MDDQQQPYAPNESQSCTKAACNCGYMRVARVLVGTLLATVLLANLVVYAAPDLAGKLGGYLMPKECCPANCTTGECPEMLPIGLPASVLEPPGDSAFDATEVAEAKD